MSVGVDVVKRGTVLDSRLCAWLAYMKQKRLMNDLCVRHTINQCFFLFINQAGLGVGFYFREQLPIYSTFRVLHN